MSEYISKEELYEQIAEREDIARKRMLDTPATLPCPNTINPAYTRYVAQLTERTAFKHMIADFEAAEVAPVEHRAWKVYPINDYKGRRTGNYRITCGCGYAKSVWHKDSFPRFCENCGARMDGTREEE